MRTFESYVKEELGIDVPKGNIGGDWFSKNHIPMIVACTSCGMTMASPFALINRDGECFCSDCGRFDYED